MNNEEQPKKDAKTDEKEPKDFKAPILTDFEVEEANDVPANLTEPETITAWKALHPGKVTVSSLLTLLFLWLERNRSWKPTNIQEIITLRLMRLFTLWVIVGLTYFLFTGAIWLLLSAPILAVPLRMALRYHFDNNPLPQRSKRRSLVRKRA